MRHVASTSPDQLLLPFPAAVLQRIDPTRNMARFYSILHLHSLPRRPTRGMNTALVQRLRDPAASFDDDVSPGKK